MCELSTTAEVADHTVVLELLEDTNDVIPINPRNKKQQKMTAIGNIYFVAFDFLILVSLSSLNDTST